MSNAAANLVALNTLIRREIARIMRIWTQTLIPPAITMTLYFVIFGKLIGSKIGIVQGHFTYMQYIVPGLVMMSIITNSYGNISSSFFGAKFSRAVEEMLVSPMPRMPKRNALTMYRMGLASDASRHGEPSMLTE